MANARVVIATPSVIDQKRLESALITTTKFDVVAMTSNLSQTYLQVEALMPDYVLIADSFARQEEYQCMEALFRAVQARVVPILGAANHGFGKHAILQDAVQPAGLQLPYAIRATMAPKDIAKAMLSAPSEALLRSQPVTPRPFSPPVLAKVGIGHANSRPIVLIGASTGGIDALTTILPHLPANCPPTAIVQHTGQNFAETLARLLDKHCAAKVLLAASGLEMSQGRICLAGGIDGHLHLSKQSAIVCNVVRGPATSGHRPSIDELFLSALPFASDVIAILLTGMGRDGAEGLLALRKAGAVTIGQDEGSSVVYGMPRVANELGAVQYQMALSDIGPAIMDMTKTACVQQKRALR